MRVADISVNRSEHHSVRLLVGAWEILVLQYEYGPEKIVIHGYKKMSRRAYPDAAREFDRLSLRYGIDTDNGSTKAALTYGQGAMGVQNIHGMIKQEEALELTEQLEEVELAKNVVPNEVAVELIAQNPIPGEDKSKSNESTLIALLTEALAQNKALAARLDALETPSVAQADGKPTLSLKGKGAAAA
jgi:hypothetical protein